MQASQPQCSNGGSSLTSPVGQLHRIGPGLPGAGLLCQSLIREPSRIDAVSIMVSGRGPIRAPRSRKSPRQTRATAPARVAQRIEFPDSQAPETTQPGGEPEAPRTSTVDNGRTPIMSCQQTKLMGLSIADSIGCRRRLVSKTASGKTPGTSCLVRTERAAVMGRVTHGKLVRDGLREQQD